MMKRYLLFCFLSLVLCGVGTGCVGNENFDASRALRIGEISTTAALDIAEVHGADPLKLAQARLTGELFFTMLREILTEIDADYISSP